LRTGSLTDLVRDSYRCERWGGTFVSGSKPGTQRYWPVMGGSSFSSRDFRARTAAKLPPADAPPTTRPREGVALSSVLLVIAHLSASQQSLTPSGNLCSGARLYIVSVTSYDIHVIKWSHRYSTFTQTAPKSRVNIRQFKSSSVRSPMHQPPSWYIMINGLPPSGGAATG
jgi:hypothetical protein